MDSIRKGKKRKKGGGGELYVFHEFDSCCVVVVVEILFRIADQTGRFAQYYDGDIIREVNSKEMKCLVHVVYHQ